MLLIARLKTITIMKCLFWKAVSGRGWSGLLGSGLVRQADGWSWTLTQQSENWSGTMDAKA